MASCFVRSLSSTFAIGVLMLSLVTSLPVHSQPKTADELKPDFSELRKLIKAEMAARSIPSLSVAVVRRGEIIWEEAFGFADREKGVAANQQTMY